MWPSVEFWRVVVIYDVEYQKMSKDTDTPQFSLAVNEFMKNSGVNPLKKQLEISSFRYLKYANFYGLV